MTYPGDVASREDITEAPDPTVVTHEHDVWPGIIGADVYDEGYPDETAGHIEAPPRLYPDSDIVAVPGGHDVGWNPELEHDSGQRPEGVGEAHTNDRIAEAVANKRHEVRHRRPTSTTADTTVMGNETLPTTNSPIRILKRNNNRRSVIVSNPGASTIFVGREGAISSAPSPNVIYIPAGQSRTLYYKGEVWIVGTAAGIVDWVEENYQT